VASQAMAAYDQLLLLNSRERGLWQGLFSFKIKKEPADFSEDDFIVKQLGLALEKKETAKSLVTASMLVQKVLLSSRRCESDACQELALTQDEREKLTKKLDSFAEGNLDWGLKPGQTSLQGCIAALREVLEDPLYISQKN